MASGIDFKTVDPVVQLIASGSGGGLPLTGGTLMGDLTMQIPSKVVQCQAPVGPCDLTNKAYVDSLIGGGSFLPLVGGTMSGAIVQPIAPAADDDLVNKTYVDGQFQPKQPSAVDGNVAVFGVGQTVDSNFSIDTNPLSAPSNTTLWPSNRILSTLQYGAEIFKATAAIPNLAPAGQVKAFSTGNAKVGPDFWATGAEFSMTAGGDATITNPFSFDTYYRITFVACALSESTGAFGTVECQFEDSVGPTLIGVPKVLKVLAAPPAFTNEVYLTALIFIAVGSSFTFSVRLTNIGVNNVTIDPDSPVNPCLLIMERVS